MTENDKNKRQATRVPTSLKVDWASEGNFLFENATNISEHGIFIETKKPMDAGTMINLQFRVPDTKDKVEVLGEVIWTNPLRPEAGENHNPGMGIRFVNLREIDRDTILSLVKRLAVL
jgi:type IV pilus assembly protein PilZ